MYEENAWYLIARDSDKEGKAVGYGHFRFDMDYDDEVLYVYEVQMEPEYKRKGLGRFMMQVRTRVVGCRYCKPCQPHHVSIVPRS